MDKRTQLNVMYAVSALFVIMVFQRWLRERPVKVLLYSEFEQLLKDKQIEEVYVRSDFLNQTT
jgi:cell division protease FtsH